MLPIAVQIPGVEFSPQERGSRDATQNVHSVYQGGIWETRMFHAAAATLARSMKQEQHGDHSPSVWRQRNCGVPRKLGVGHPVDLASAPKDVALASSTNTFETKPRGTRPDSVQQDASRLALTQRRSLIPVVIDSGPPQRQRHSRLRTG